MARARTSATGGGAAGPIRAGAGTPRITDRATTRAGAGAATGTGGAPATKPADVKALQTGIEQAVSEQIAARLSTNGGGLTPGLKTTISKAAADAAARAVDLAVTKEINDAVTDVARGSLLGKFDARVDLARKGIDHIVASDDVQQIMKQRAEMLAGKKRALEAAGFSSDEAMDIILADIAARGH